MALAPSRPLLSVPSSAIIARSISRLVLAASMPTSASAISPLTASTAGEHALAEIAASCRHRAVRLMRAGRRARGHRGAAEAAIFEQRHRLRRSDCPRLSRISRAWMSMIAVMSLDSKDVDQLLGEARDFVRKSPAVAIGAAAIAGYVLMRLARGSSSED
jgi:hypothetical protein